MNRKELFYFTGKCLSLDTNPHNVKIIRSAIKNNLVNWELFIRLASDHLVTQTIYSKLKKHNLLDELPDELVDVMEEIYNLSLNRNKLIISQIKEITQLLNEHEIEPLYLKGAGNLIDNIYEDPGERILGDIDFLVAEKDYLKAAQVLENAGYAGPDVFWGDVKTLKHYPRLNHPEKTASVEVHRLPVNEQYCKWFSPADAFANSKTIEDFPGCSVLSDEYKVVVNFIHSQLSNKGNLYGVVSLRDGYDLLQISTRVSFSTIIPLLKTKQKALQYFSLCEEILSTDFGYGNVYKTSSKWFKVKHDLNLDSFVFYKIHKISVKLFERIIIGYMGQIVQSFYSRSVRRSVIQRLSSLKWYKSHLESWQGFTK